MIKFILHYLGNFKLKFFLILLCAIVTAAADLLMPYLSAKFIDEILSSREIGRLSLRYLFNKNACANHQQLD